MIAHHCMMWSIKRTIDKNEFPKSARQTDRQKTNKKHTNRQRTKARGTPNPLAKI